MLYEILRKIKEAQMLQYYSSEMILRHLRSILFCSVLTENF